jgi:nitroimidazol reductase NimA-like FMN-containing flavoprotein (pyridoxamine 5'-phosphate oxidase superfamily)
MLDRMKALVKAKDICVLATVADDTPHCSLMAYATNDDANEVYMVTYRNTKKFRNLLANARVSLLIDTRDEDFGERRPNAQALTVTGQFQPITDERRRDSARTCLLERHPHLRTFTDHPDAEVFAIKLQSLQLLDGLTRSYFATVE